MADGRKIEALFYHLEHQPLEDVLPTLLEKTRERGWKAVVESRDATRLEALDAHLWTYREDSFLAHGMAKDDHAERQPIILTTGPENPNGAQIRFLVHGSEPGGIDAYERIVIMIDGRDQDAVAAARRQWQAMKQAGCEVTYWQQDASRRWIRKG